jgi:hypothetical protein
MVLDALLIRERLKIANPEREQRGLASCSAYLKGLVHAALFSSAVVVPLFAM